MRQVRRLLQLHANEMLGPTLAGRFDAYEMINGLTGYILEQSPAAALSGRSRAWDYVTVVARVLGEPEASMRATVQPPPEVTHQMRLPLQPLGRLVPVATAQGGSAAVHNIRILRPVRSGQTYRLTSPPTRGLVRPELAEALETVFERFAREAGFTPDKPLDIQLWRGFKAGSHGHGEGQAVDIAAVGGKSLLAWKQEGDRAMADAEKLSDPQQRAEAIGAERRRNLGYGLYKALQAHGGWRVNQDGWRVYRGVIQLFGPWTATEGPWKQMQIKKPNAYQQKRLADQQWVFQAHQDHIHVAR